METIRTFSRRKSAVEAPALDGMCLERYVDGDVDEHRRGPRILEKLERARARQAKKAEKAEKDAKRYFVDPGLESKKRLLEAMEKRQVEYAKQKSLNRREQQLAISLLCEMGALGMRVTAQTPWAKKFVSSTILIQRAFRRRLERKKLQRMHDLINDDVKPLMVKPVGWSGWKVQHDKFSTGPDGAMNGSIADYYSSFDSWGSNEDSYSDTSSCSSSSCSDESDVDSSDDKSRHIHGGRKLRTKQKIQDKGIRRRRKQALDTGKDAVSSPPTFDTHSSGQSDHWGLIRRDLRRACRAIGLRHEFIEEKCNEDIGGITSIFRIFSMKADLMQQESNKDNGGHHETSIAEAAENDDDAITGTQQRTAARDGSFSIQVVSHSSIKGSSEDTTSRHPANMGYTVLLRGSGTESSSNHFAAAAQSPMMATPGFTSQSKNTAETRPRSDGRRMVIDANPQAQAGAFSPGRLLVRRRRTARLNYTRAAGTDDICGKESESRKPMANLDFRDLAQSTSGMGHLSRPQALAPLGMASPPTLTGRQQMSALENEQSAESRRDALLASSVRFSEHSQTENLRHGKVPVRRRRTAGSESELLVPSHRGLSGSLTTPTFHATGRGMEMFSPSSRGNLSIADSQCQGDEQCRPWMEAAVDEKGKLPAIGQAAGQVALWPWLMTAQEHKEPSHSSQGSTTYSWTKGTNKVSKGLGPMTKVSHIKLAPRTARRVRCRESTALVMQGHNNTQDRKAEWLPQINHQKLGNRPAVMSLERDKFIDDQQLLTFGGSPRPYQERNSALPESKSVLF